jgi:hypothetical protein
MRMSTHRLIDHTYRASPARRTSRGDLARLARDVWIATVAGGALCGLYSLGLISIFFFFLSVPLGAGVGLVVGGPLGLALATWVRYLTARAMAADHLVPVLSVVGVMVAVGAGVIVPVLLGLGPASVAGPLYPGVLTGSIADRLAVVGSALVVLAAMAATGWLMGRVVACRHLRRLANRDTPDPSSIQGAGGQPATPGVVRKPGLQELETTRTSRRSPLNPPALGGSGTDGP